MGFAADEIPMPPGDPETLERGVNSLQAVHSPATTNYLVTNGSNEAFFAAAWPSGSAVGAAGSEAHTLVGLLRTGARHVDTGAKAMAKYHKALAGAHHKITGWHTEWDAAENTYSQKMRTLDRTTPAGSPDYDDFREAYRADRDQVQNPIRKKYHSTMADLKQAAQTATHSIGLLFSEALRPGDAIDSSVSDYLLNQLPQTQHALDAQAGRDLANDIKKQQAKHPPDYRKIRADMTHLVNYQNNPYFNHAFVKTLGPRGILELPDALRRTMSVPPSQKELKANGRLLTLAANATAGYIAEHPNFGARLLAEARKTYTEDPLLSRDLHPLEGYRNLSLILAAGDHWPASFLTSAADEIYTKERQIGGNNPWDIGTTFPRVTDQDPGHGDPMVNVLHALGKNDTAARDFFSTDSTDNGDQDRDKITYLVRLRRYGPTDNPGNTPPADNGKSLGEALLAASRQHPDQDPANLSGRITSELFDDIARKNYQGKELPDYGYHQPPGMRPYTGHILKNYIHDVDNTLGGSGTTAEDRGPRSVTFHYDALRKTMSDTFIDEGAYKEVMRASIIDNRKTILDHLSGASDYDQAKDQLDFDMTRAGDSMGSIYNARVQPILTADQGKDASNGQIQSSVSTVLGVATLPFSPAVGATGQAVGEVWGRGLGEYLLPTDHGATLVAHNNQDAADTAMKDTPLGHQIDHRLDELWKASDKDTHDPKSSTNLYWEHYQNAFVARGGENLDGDAEERWNHKYKEGPHK
ncbi:MAG TPA: DUF6571 family protein [Mycobacteriales bacterium]|nr:DUF6571 family protein [Mycobacteriales bacterium]